MKKRSITAAASLLLLAVCVLCACAADYADGIDCAELGRSMSDGLENGEEYAEFEPAHREYYFKNTEYYDDCSLLYSRDTRDIGEIGVFHSPDEDSAKAMEEECRKYLDDLRTGTRAFIESYAPDELAKLDAAKVRRFGSYVVYTVLPSNEANSLFKALEKTLKK